MLATINNKPVREWARALLSFKRTATVPIIRLSVGLRVTPKLMSRLPQFCEMCLKGPQGWLIRVPSFRM